MIDKQQAAKNKVTIVNLLKQTEREGIEGLIHWLDTDGFFESPASTQFHGNYDGGLAYHSLNVYEEFNHLNERYNLGLEQDTITLVGLLHDACKVGLYEPNILKSGNRSESKPYKTNGEFPFGHGELSVYYVQQHIQLTPEEALLIRWHMEKYDATYDFVNGQGDRIRNAVPSLCALSCADKLASAYIDDINPSKVSQQQQQTQA